MQKKLSTGQARDNSVTAALETTTRTTKEEANLSQRNRELEKGNKALQDKLDEIADIVECDDPDCSAEERLEDIADILPPKVMATRGESNGQCWRKPATVIQ